MQLEQRIEKVERELRAWRCISIGLALLVGLSLSCSRGEAPSILPRAKAELIRPIAEKLTAHAIEIVNPAGDVVVTIGAGTDGGILSLVNPSSKAAISFMILGPLAKCVLSDASGTADITPSSISLNVRTPEQERRFKEALRVLEDRKRAGEEPSAGELSAVAKAGPAPAVAIQRSDYGGVVRIYNGDGKTAAVTIAATESTGGLIDVSNRAGKTVAAIDSIEGGGGGIGVYNAFGKAVVELQSNKTNQGALYLNNVNGDLGKAVTADSDR